MARIEIEAPAAPAAIPAAGPSWWPGATTQIFLGLAIGVALGAIRPDVAVTIKPLADAFLRMIKMIIAPLLFSTLVVGIAGTGDMKAMGRIGLKALVYFEVATTIALFLGLGLVNWFQPGAGVSVAGTATTDVAVMATRQQSVTEIFLHLFPTSIFDAMARGDILQVVVFASFFGVALAGIGEKGRPVLEFLESVAQVMFKFTAYVMMFAPLGVMAAMAATVGGRGPGILLTLGKLVGVMYLGLFVFLFIVIGGVALLIRVPFFTFLRAIREPFLIAFTTASSEAALPKALEVMARFGVPRNIVGFVLPTGYSFNLDGTTLYLSIASVFVAQLAGLQMSLGQQLMMMLTLMLTSKGVAGVPRGALVVLTAALGTFGLPLEGAAILLGIDQILDMGRTAVNVTGNCLATAVVARWEGVLDDRQIEQFR
ncbi:Glutamate-aspartate carrier protein [Luteitalea pratensis]|uniref:Glutamate-aspartate carrier protein n=1 Tax=Luteitalea pratensis TaxID=1855912 RepID=A0A143PVC3_LUTPR|nr:cation:dicarboxylase symporter family transporter [Luteitalea pratensis]AMY11739.1 Glutamate-aspartate carrier protein [Luteitalea pratensis]